MKNLLDAAQAPFPVPSALGSPPACSSPLPGQERAQSPRPRPPLRGARSGLLDSAAHKTREPADRGLSALEGMLGGARPCHRWSLAASARLSPVWARPLAASSGRRLRVPHSGDQNKLRASSCVGYFLPDAHFLTFVYTLDYLAFVYLVPKCHVGHTL